MKLNKNIIFLAAFSMSCASFAGNLKSSNISLDGGGTLKPRESLSISLDKLVAGGSYHVTCKITDPNNQKNKVSLVVSDYDSMSPMGGGRIVVNGSEISSGGRAQVELSQVSNVVEFFNVWQNNYLSFTNLDQDDSVTISDCVAVAK